MCLHFPFSLCYIVSVLEVRFSSSHSFTIKGFILAASTITEVHQYATGTVLY